MRSFTLVVSLVLASHIAAITRGSMQVLDQPSLTWQASLSTARDSLPNASACEASDLLWTLFIPRHGDSTSRLYSGKSGDILLLRVRGPSSGVPVLVTVPRPLYASYEGSLLELASYGKKISI